MYLAVSDFQKFVHMQKKLKYQMIILQTNTCIVITPARIRFTSKRRTSLLSQFSNIIYLMGQDFQLI